MPDTFKSIVTTIGNTATNQLYSTPNNTTTIIKSLYGANTGTADSILMSVLIGNTGSTSRFLIRNAVLPIQSTLQPITEPVVLEVNERIEVTCSVANNLDIIMSYLEIT